MSERITDIDRRTFFATGGRAAGPPGAEPLALEASQPEVVRALDHLLRDAVRLRASDVHLEPRDRGHRVRLRIDGQLRDAPEMASKLGTGIVSRVKVLARLDIGQKRVPQDGRIRLKAAGRELELRVSTIPAMHGESVVMRLLDRTVVSLDLETLGLSLDVVERLRNCLRQTSGILLLTGPTGSGKTTTLYAALSELNVEDVKIVTTEDPVEYDLDGTMQVEIAPDIGLTFARSLRAILRQDPDIILVGEIRDPETAKIAAEAALTGHLVLSTLHTRDAPSAVARLVDMGVEPFLVADTVRGVLAQRLVRRLCAECRSRRSPDASESAALVAAGLSPDGPLFEKGAGCARCDGTGWNGRVALGEFLEVTDAVRDRIETNAEIDEIRAAVRGTGVFRTLRREGLAAAVAGETTFEEVATSTPELT
ncbi:MAG: type II/IV secretion system protein [Planctomycetes bacterium]|nr:type II/IV secretion system protein [Planctomycetota bacterium]MBI3844254.1 type II/IV secretion system protein [Planctomycetota bacterium]